MKSLKNADNGYILIFRPWITTRDGKRIYPRRGRVFCLRVRAEK